MSARNSQTRGIPIPGRNASNYSQSGRNVSREGCSTRGFGFSNDRGLKGTGVHRCKRTPRGVAAPNDIYVQNTPKGKNSRPPERDARDNRPTPFDAKRANVRQKDLSAENHANLPLLVILRQWSHSFPPNARGREVQETAECGGLLTTPCLCAPTYFPFFVSVLRNTGWPERIICSLSVQQVFSNNIAGLSSLHRGR